MRLPTAALIALASLAGCAAPRSGEATAEPPAAATAGVCPTCGRPLEADGPGPGRAEGAFSDVLRASVGGKYRGLLAMLPLPGDREKYGEFKDWGYWAGTSYSGYHDLPSGHWVYVCPNWYIWGAVDRGAAPAVIIMD